MPGSSDDHLRQPTTETDVIDHSIVMDSGTARGSDEGADQVVWIRKKGVQQKSRHDED